MSEHAPDRLLSGIDIPKTIAGVLAAVSAAVVGSFLGVGGTLAGAAVASVVGSVGTEVYRKFINRGHKKIVATFVTAPAAIGTPSVAAAEEEVPSDPSPSDPSPSDPSPPASRKMRWGRVALVAGSVFVLAIGALTVFELIAGKTAADAVTGHHSSSSSTLGTVFGGHQKSSDNPAPAASTPASVAPSDDTGPTGNGAPTTQPTATDTTTPSAPSTPAETTPTSPEPTTTDTQNSDGNGGGDIAPPATPQAQETR